ncbi:tetratricopeptide repeat protein [Spongiactinospora sp. TRM90649]|uniref:tetratricopeptide repeat protein n=1 Tax=Spongiactinospora sp. TRM90649 TaxID=3031114 RepID=UPI0023F818FB|nr:tetratricopeptide repeat protein [Spongiactinospora sp. TRM90649]MDF5758752.1 tetratricopeptide repeat protein [Spongiactinospora sp. TRM90649]
MIDHSCHVWLQGERSGDRAALLASWGPLPLVTAALDAHRRTRGPYTFGGALLGALVPGVLRRSPGLVAAHDIEIRAAAPGLRDLVTPRWETCDARQSDDERILVPAPRRTLRIANGITEFLSEGVEPGGVLVVENAHHADATDRELLAVLVRRLPPERLTVVICSAEPPPATFSGARAHAEPQPLSGDVSAARYVESDCTTDDPRLAAAYRALPPGARAALHERRAAELLGLGDPAPLLGAIPFHLEHGSDPGGSGVEALWAAVDHCVREGFLDAVVETGLRGLALAEAGGDLWWRFLQRTATAMAGLRRHDEARDLWNLARRTSVEPAVHAAAAYGTAMLDARHPDPAARDLGRAMGWINQAIAISTLLPDPEERAFKLGFDRNGRALVELRHGRLPQALDLVESAMELADRDLPPGRHRTHRMVLLANRAQLLTALGRGKEALDDYNAAVTLDPAFPDHYLDRGNLRFRQGMLDGALDDYETAMRLSPPLPEAYYNRAQVRLACDEREAALADLDHVLELDPGYLDAHINRAGVLAVEGREAEARADVEAGLAIDPRNAHLHCVLGQLECGAGRHAEALSAFGEALAADPELGAAWANRAIARFESGDPEGAVADLTRALALERSAELHYNRALALRALGREDEALDDLHLALDLDPDDPEIHAALAVTSGRA